MSISQIVDLSFSEFSQSLTLVFRVLQIIDFLSQGRCQKVEKFVASQLADETLFLSYPKEELESKFLVDPSPLRACSVLFAKAYNKPFCLKQQMSVLCCLVYSALHVSSFKMSRFCAMHFSE